MIHAACRRFRPRRPSRRVHVPKALEQLFAVALQRAPIATDHPSRERFDIAAVGQVLDRDDQRRVAGDPRLTVDDRREL